MSARGEATRYVGQMKRLFFPLAIAATLLLSACSSGASAPAESEAPAASSTVAADRTAELQAALSPDAAELVVAAAEPEVGRVNVETTIVDPRGDAGSAEAASALAICEAAAHLDEVTYVSVAEADGSTFVLYGHPSVPEGACGEV